MNAAGQPMLIYSLIPFRGKHFEECVKKTSPGAMVVSRLPEKLQSFSTTATIVDVKRDFPPPVLKDITCQLGDPFTPGTLAVVSLGNPKAKFWGMVLASAPTGLSLCGVDLASLEDLAAMVKDGEHCTPAIVFFPMHRVERMELDLRCGNVPSLAERLFATTGLRASMWFLPSTVMEAPPVKKVRGMRLRPIGETP
jgi:hypothetical protein